MNIDRGEFAEVIETNAHPCIDKPARRRNNKYAWHPSERACKRICVSNLSAKIKAAQKSKHLRDWYALGVAQFSREIEFRLLAQNHPGSLAAGVSGRKKENPAGDIVFYSLQVSDPPVVSASSVKDYESVKRFAKVRDRRKT